MAYILKFKTGHCSLCNKKTTGYKYCKICAKKNQTKKYHDSKKTRFCIICNQQIDGYRYCVQCYGIHRKKQVKIGGEIYRKKNRDKISLNSRKKNKNPYVRKRRKISRLKYYLKNKQKLLLKCREKYAIKIGRPIKRKMTEEELIEWRKEYARKYYPVYFKNNPSKKIAAIFRQRLWRLTKGIPVKHNMEKIIGCTLADLKIYLTNKFKEGMTWNNHSKTGWHIDHIIPCFKFDLTKYGEVKKCFNYANLQPLWAKDNMKKSKK